MARAYTKSTQILHKQANSLHECNESKFGWDEVISVAEAEIEKCLNRLAALRKAIRRARKHKRDGMPFEEGGSNVLTASTHK